MNGDRTKGGPVHLGKLPGYLGYQVRQAQTAVFRDFAQIMENVGITPGEFSLLTLTEANPGINQGTLARVYQLDKSTLSTSINGLIRRGLIERTRSDRDRRFYALWLTDAGRDALGQATRLVEKEEAQMDAALEPGEREQLLGLLEKITAAFRR